MFKHTFIINLVRDIYQNVHLVYRTMNRMMNYQIPNEHHNNNFIINDTDGANRFDNLLVLSVWNEFKGICGGYEIKESSIYIFIEEKVINVSKNETIVTFLKSKGVIGKRIAVLRTDISNKDYLFRLLEE